MVKGNDKLIIIGNTDNLKNCQYNNGINGKSMIIFVSWLQKDGIKNKIFFKYCLQRVCAEYKFYYYFKKPLKRSISTQMVDIVVELIARFINLIISSQCKEEPKGVHHV